LKKLGITSNGYLLESKLSFLSETNCRHLNVSLDSLNDKTFAGVTKTRTFNRVHRAVLKARDMGFNVKVNAVLLKGENDGELLDFVDFSAREGITVRFLELMKIGPMYGENASKFMAAREAIDRIEVRESLRRVPAPADSTAYYFDTASGARIGFIASESEPFCGSCSRLRLSDTGVLRSCLMSCAGLSLRGKPRAQYPELLRAVMAMKPAERIHHVDQPMHEIGG
jgi:cyclic pyranopterin phosphate synthase